MRWATSESLNVNVAMSKQKCPSENPKGHFMTNGPAVFASSANDVSICASESNLRDVRRVAFIVSVLCLERRERGE
jgi:hypothetical protein